MFRDHKTKTIILLCLVIGLADPGKAFRQIEAAEESGSSIAPRSDDAHRSLSEAESLFQKGMKKEPLFIWRSLLFLDRIYGKKFFYLKEAAEKSAKRINELRNKSDLFGEIESAVPFVLFYDPSIRATFLSGEEFGFYFRIPGEWRFSIHSHPTSNKNEEEIFRSIHLKEIAREITLSVSAEYLRPGGTPFNENDYIYLWDRRRTLPEKRKKYFYFSRKPHPLLQPLCRKTLYTENSLSENLSPNGGGKKRFCTVLESTATFMAEEKHDPLVHRFEKDTDPPPSYSKKEHRYYELYYIFENRGTRIEIATANRSEDGFAEKIAEEIVKTIMLTHSL